LWRGGLCSRRYPVPMLASLSASGWDSPWSIRIPTTDIRTVIHTPTMDTTVRQRTWDHRFTGPTATASITAATVEDTIVTGGKSLSEFS
jgi:hypothetical protein